MNLAGIISISGRPGLFKVVAQSKNSVIVESLIDKKKIPAYASDRISALEDISIYTYEGDKPLKEIYIDFLEKLNGDEAPSHKSSINELKEFLVDILPDYDEDRVYPSDIKKIFQWYNILLKADLIQPETKEETEEELVVEQKEAKEKKPVKKTTKKTVKKDDK